MNCENCGDPLRTTAPGDFHFCSKQECINARQRSWNARHPESIARSNLRAKAVMYGLDPDEMERIVAEHNGLCDSCGLPLEDGTYKKRFDIDHDHTTHKFRGLLHPSCNLGMGCFGDDPALLRLAADYLERTGKDGR